MAIPKLMNKKHNLKMSKILKSSPDYIIPSDPEEPSSELYDYTYLIYGEPKVGKTSLVSNFEKVLFFMFEPGARSLNIYKCPSGAGCFTNWKDVIGYSKALQKNKGRFSSVCFDPGSRAYDLCLDYVCKMKNISHPGMMKDYGASWKAVSSEFQKMHERIAEAGLAFIVLAHVKIEEFTGADGRTYNRIVPKFSGATGDFYEGIIDNIFYYHYHGSKRFLQIRGTESIVAGTRCEERFLTPDGEQIYKIPMGNSSKEAYENLLRAFNNEQEETYSEDKVKSENKKKFTIKKSRRLIISGD